MLYRFHKDMKKKKKRPLTRQENCYSLFEVEEVSTLYSCKKEHKMWNPV